MVQEIRERDAQPVHEARAVLRAGISGRGLVQEAGFLLVAATALAVLGAFGVAGEAPWHERLAYWLRTTFIGYLIHRALIWVAALWTVRLDLPEWVGWVAGALLAAAPMTLWLWWLGPVVDLSRPPPSFPAFVQTYGQVVVLAAIAFAVLWLLKSPASGRQDGSASDPASEEAAGARLMRRLPAGLQTELVAIGVEDHYVRVFTRNGDTLLLMRLADAIAETEGIEGMQVHRSWWVARASITHVERRGRTTELIVGSGLVVPVARRRLADLRALGWI